MAMTWQQFSKPWLQKKKKGGLKAAGKAWAKSPSNPKNQGGGGGSSSGSSGSSSSGSKTGRAATFKRVHRAMYGVMVAQLASSTTVRQQVADLVDDLQASAPSAGGGGVIIGPGGSIGGGFTGGGVTGESILATFDRIQNQSTMGEDVYALDLLDNFDFYGFFDTLFNNAFSTPGDFLQVVRNAMSEPGIGGKVKGVMAIIEMYPGIALSALYVLDTSMAYDVAEIADQTPFAGMVLKRVEERVPKKFDPGKYARMLK